MVEEEYVIGKFKSDSILLKRDILIWKTFWKMDGRGEKENSGILDFLVCMCKYPRFVVL
jgi:hypothetical protein